MQSLKPEAVKVHSLFSKCPSPNSFNPVVGLSCFFFFPFPNMWKKLEAKTALLWEAVNRRLNMF